MLKREMSLQLLKNHIDVLIIGGGINGVGIARECALRGISTLCVDKNDFASGTSSASSKLAHGGLRYLEQGEVKLVLEACRERERLFTNASRLVKPLSFLLPIYQDSPYSPLKIKLGLTLYDALSFFKTATPHKMLSANEVLEKEPWLDENGLRGGALYVDGQMNDARLCLEVGLQSETFGAKLLNYVEVTSLKKDKNHYIASLLDSLTQTTYTVNASVIVNATGVWSDQLQSLFKEHHVPRVRPSKGIHIITKRISQQHAVLLTTKKDGRVYFVIPWNEYSLIGTTDTDYTNSLDHIDITADEINYLIQETNTYFPKAHLTQADIISAFAGLRPLLKNPEDSVGKVSREEKIIVNDNCISIVGGKYTTFRSISEKAAKRIWSCLHQKIKFKSLTKKLTLFDIPIASNPNAQYEIDSKLCSISSEVYQKLLKKYGSRYTFIIDICRENKEYTNILPQTHLIVAELIYSIRYEHARTIEDFMRRRTKLMLSEENGLQVLTIVAEYFKSELDWTDDFMESQINIYKEQVKTMRSCFS